MGRETIWSLWFASSLIPPKPHRFGDFFAQLLGTFRNITYLCPR